MLQFDVEVSEWESQSLEMKFGRKHKIVAPSNYVFFGTQQKKDFNTVYFFSWMNSRSKGRK